MFPSELVVSLLTHKQIIETHGRPWIMLNILNIGFEHAIRFSVDDHKMWIVANDGGFVVPQLVDVLYITNGVRYTVLIKLDQESADYAMRLVSTSNHQNLHGYSILRYPVCLAIFSSRSSVLLTS